MERSGASNDDVGHHLLPGLGAQPPLVYLWVPSALKDFLIKLDVVQQSESLNEKSFQYFPPTLDLRSHLAAVE